MNVDFVVRVLGKRIHKLYNASLEFIRDDSLINVH